MTILGRGSVFLAEAVSGTTEFSFRPELRRSVVEGPAVLSPEFLHNLSSLSILLKIRCKSSSGCGGVKNTGFLCFIRTSPCLPYANGIAPAI